jgi:hypothetical protein
MLLTLTFEALMFKTLAVKTLRFKTYGFKYMALNIIAKFDCYRLSVMTINKDNPQLDKIVPEKLSKSVIQIGFSARQLMPIA